MRENRPSGSEGGGTKPIALPTPILNLLMLSPAPRADKISGILTWGFAALHPRLYAVARSAGCALRSPP